jgi:hypothetical protein
VVNAALARDEHDLEAMEVAVRDAVLAAGANALGGFMSAAAVKASTGTVCCDTCRVPMRSTGLRKKTILTLLGEVAYTRPRYRCLACAQVRYPGDKALDIVGTSRSPSVRRQAARLGAKEPFTEVAQDLRELAGITLSRKDAERIAEGVGADIEARDARERERLRFAPVPPPECPKTIETLYIEMDGTGVPMVPWELAGRKGKQADGSARTREVKLGCVFTQTLLDDQGRPVRDPASCTFTGAIEDAAACGRRLYAEAVRRGLYLAKRVVVIGDGAEWIGNLAGERFGMAQRIVDFYHAKEHVASLCRALFTKPQSIELHRERWWELLEQGNIEEIIGQAQAVLRQPENNPDAWREIEYLRKNREHMRYAHYREQGLFIGSGVIEAACKNLVGKRLKQSGMEWTVCGANSIIALRCAMLSNRFTEYWDQRAA